jgi:hypothetical protein
VLQYTETVSGLCSLNIFRPMFAKQFQAYARRTVSGICSPNSLRTTLAEQFQAYARRTVSGICSPNSFRPTFAEQFQAYVSWTVSGLCSLNHFDSALHINNLGTPTWTLNAKKDQKMKIYKDKSNENVKNLLLSKLWHAGSVQLIHCSTQSHSTAHITRLWPKPVTGCAYSCT